MEIYPFKVPKTSTDSKFDTIMTYLGSFEVKLGSKPDIRVKLCKVIETTNNADMLYTIRTTLGQKLWSELTTCGHEFEFSQNLRHLIRQTSADIYCYILFILNGCQTDFPMKIIHER